MSTSTMIETVTDSLTAPATLRALWSLGVVAVSVPAPGPQTPARGGSVIRTPLPAGVSEADHRDAIALVIEAVTADHGTGR